MLYFTSDTHFNHYNIIKYCNRPYENCREMNDDLILKWNSVVSQEDTIIHVGDVTFGNPSMTREFFKNLNGYKILVKGNHDRINKIRPFFDEVHSELFVKVKDKVAWIRHFYLELRTDGTKEPFDFSIHGHSHGNLGKTHITNYRKHPYKGKEEPILEIDAGVDCWNYTPVSEDQIYKEVQLFLERDK